MAILHGTYSNSCSSCTSFDKAACLLRFPDAISLLLMYSSGMELHSYWPKYAEQPLPSTICTDGTADKSELVFLQAATMSYPWIAAPLSAAAQLFRSGMQHVAAHRKSWVLLRC